MTESSKTSPFELLKRQRSHVLFVLSDARGGHEKSFLEWYLGAYRKGMLNERHVLSARHYKQHEVDVTQGRFPPLPFRYLGVYELSIDGAEMAEPLIEYIEQLHRQESSAKVPATWLYYPAGEKVGRSASAQPSMITLAFANGLPGEEAAFREWYATRHIRHALNIPVFVSGQCFERTQYQRPGALEPDFSTIAVYEQEGPPEVIIECFATLPPETLRFPSIDLTRFAEWVYQPLA